MGHEKRVDGMGRGGCVFEFNVLFRFLKCLLRFAETPATATERIRFQDGAVRERNPKEIKITWEKQNLTTNFDAQIKVSLYGYREVTIAPELVYIDVIAVSINI